jgi:hypothetical protein
MINKDFMEYTYKPVSGETWNFIAMEYYLGILNHTYQIFVTPEVIAGGFVNGLAAAPMRLPKNWFVPERWAKKKWLEKYEKVSPASRNFMRFNPRRNFQYRREDIRRFWYSPTTKWGMGTVAHSGKLYLELCNRKKREFILLGLQQGKEYIEYLQSGHTSRATFDAYAEVHPLLNKAYGQAEDLETWLNLAELFSTLGEEAQALYCRTYSSYLLPF